MSQHASWPLEYTEMDAALSGYNEGVRFSLSLRFFITFSQFRLYMGLNVLCYTQVTAVLFAGEMSHHRAEAILSGNSYEARSRCFQTAS